MIPDITAHVKPAYPPIYHKAPQPICPGPATAPAKCDGDVRTARVRCDMCITTQNTAQTKPGGTR